MVGASGVLGVSGVLGAATALGASSGIGEVRMRNATQYLSQGTASKGGSQKLLLVTQC